MSGVDATTTASSALNLGSVRVYASGLGIVLYSRSLLPALRGETSTAKRDHLYTNTLESARAVSGDHKSVDGIDG